jgi:hypothetical protein
MHHFQRPIIRRGTGMLLTAFAIAMIAALAAYLAWQFKPANNFAPLSLPDRLALISGTGGPPPQIASGATLAFNNTTWCNATDAALSGHASISIISTDQPPQSSIAVLAGLPVTVQKGCTAGHSLKLDLPNPLPPGDWELALTVSVEAHGHAQTLSTISQPFVVVSP